MNKLIAIGFLGTMSCYLNITKEEALKRYKKEYNITNDDDDSTYNIIEFEFEDEFSAYSVYPNIEK